METLMIQIGEKLRNLRESKKVNLRDLARVLEVNHTALNKIENGTQRLDMETLKKVVDYFGIQADYFINPSLKLEDVKLLNYVQGDFSSAFKRVLDEYLVEKEKSFKGNNLGHFVRNDFVEILNQTMLLDESRYYVGGSVGQGVWATIPWISCFDRSISVSATNGYYLVYLFKEDMSGFYLSLNQGYTYFREKYGTREGRIKIETIAKLIRSKVVVPAEYNLTYIDLGSSRDLAIGYEKGHIYGKYYDARNIPPENELIADFKGLLESYQKIVTFMNGRSVKEFNDYLLLQEDLEFLETDEENYQKKVNEVANSQFNLLKQEDEPRPPKTPIVDEGGKERYPRSAKEAATALIRANYTCEVDPSHETFIAKATKQQYAEAHHFIGISHYKKFPEVDLDRTANIVCLCPTCHRKIHHGTDEVRLQMIVTLYKNIKERLEKVGIEITMTQLKEFYGIKSSFKYLV